MGKLVPSLVTQTVSGDTHAASLTGSNAIIPDAVAGTTTSTTTDTSGTFSQAIAHGSADITTTETTIATKSAVTPLSANNVIGMAGACAVAKITAAGTATVRIKEDGVTLVSTTSASISANDEKYISTVGTSNDSTAAAHTYILTLQYSTSGGRWMNGLLLVGVVERGAVTSMVDLIGEEVYGGANSVTIEDTGDVNMGVTETTLKTSSSVTPGTSANCLVVMGCCYLRKITNAGTFTLRLKETGGSTLFSVTSSSVGIDIFLGSGVFGTILDVSVAGHTYDFTIQASTTGAYRWASAIFVIPVDGTSGADTHAASLTGSGGTCA